MLVGMFMDIFLFWRISDGENIFGGYLWKYNIKKLHIFIFSYGKILKN